MKKAILIGMIILIALSVSCTRREDNTPEEVFENESTNYFISELMNWTGITLASHTFDVYIGNYDTNLILSVYDASDDYSNFSVMMQKEACFEAQCEEEGYICYRCEGKQ